MCFNGRGCGESAPKKPTPPSNLTERDLIRGGWTDDISDDDYNKFLEQARDAVENPPTFSFPVFKK